MEYKIKLNQGDYLQLRGGFDWGRSERYQATTFDNKEEARQVIKQFGLKSFSARIVRAW